MVYQRVEAAPFCAPQPICLLPKATRQFVADLTNASNVLRAGR